MSPHDPKGVTDDEEAAEDVVPTPETTSATASTAVELQATASMCHHCFDVLLQELKRDPKKQQQYQRKSYHQSFSALSSGSSSSNAAKPPFADSLPNESVECPLFVTWEKRSKRISSNFELRGCIGTLAPKLLLCSIGEYALLSALRDKRFDPVSMDELPNLRVIVSLIIQYEECEHCHDWTVGVHGIIIRFFTGDADEKTLSVGTELSATFLPEVAEQQGWDQTRTVAQLIRKAGYKGTVTDRLLQRIECTRYQSSKHRVTFDEYVQHLGHADGSDLRKFITGINDDDDTASSSNNKTNNNCRIM